MRLQLKIARNFGYGRSTYFADLEICFILDIFSSFLTDFTIVQTLIKLVQIFGASEFAMGLRG